jgi:HAD superfamily hydrolase (TIGR01450 family)
MRRIIREFANIKALGIDLDGVVYSGNYLMPHAKESIDAFRAMGKAIYFITNNSGKSRQEIANKLNNLGVGASEEEIYSSGYATAIFLKELDEEAEAFIIGSDGLKIEFDKLFIKISDRPIGKYLVVGFDRCFTYEKISQGYNMIRQGAKFIACNRDKSFPVEGGKSLPGCNAMVAAIEFSSGKAPDYVIGKPETFLPDLIAKKNSYLPQDILIIGDSPESDIAMANRFGSPSVLIAEKEFNGVLHKNERATFVAKSMDQIVNLLASC